MKIEDEVRKTLNKRASSVRTDADAAWVAFERRAERMDRSRRVATGLVALVVAISAFALMVRAFRPTATVPGGAGQTPSVSVAPHSSSGSSPAGSASPSQSSSNPLDRPTLKHVQVVPQRVVSSASDFLVVEAPVGEVRWKLNKDCDVSGAPVGGTNAGGFGGGGCDGGALAASDGGLSVGGTFYDMISGHAYYGQEVTVHATFVDGTTADVVTHNGLWMVVFRPQPEMYSPASKIATVEAISPTGQVLDSVKVP